MILVYMIITALVWTALAQGALECNLTQPGPQKCFGVLDEPLMFYLPTNTHTKISLKKNACNILTLSSYPLNVINKKYKNHITVFKNGTFKINKSTKNDSGEYMVEIHSSTNGSLLHTKNIYLDIQAPVLEPATSQLCLSPEEKIISCSSEGDEVEFMLFLDDNLLLQTTTKSTEKSSISKVTVTLHAQLMGKLACIVQNNVSRRQKIILITSCTGTVVTVAVVASIGTLLLVLAVFLGVKHFNKKTDPMTVNKDHSEDNIIYSDVRVKQHARKTASD
ncbi:uncharacterized protein LOC121815595 [Haplochromis burtoni]|uniref:uncharacterized protein LOC121815595 n=1 Tax=Haplochromis burtoni TaxID=8153 RepID=UPI001C2D28BB|nr:uncharacterized protein LOC121815595 [Haplochromis burtoni]